MEQELWRNIKGYEGLYFVSDKGQVLCIKHYACRKRTPKIYIRTPVLSSKKFKSRWKNIILIKDGKIKGHRIARLVATAFIPNPNNLPFVNHIDGNPQNDRVENLEWCTALENTNHAWDNGLMKRKAVRITPEMCKQMREMHSRGMKQTEIREHFGVGSGVVSTVILRKYRFQHI